MADLPESSQRYLKRVGELSGVRLAIVSLGASREATIVLENPFLG